MKRHFRGKVVLVAICVMIIHGFSLFSGERQGCCMAAPKQETFVTIPAITGRVVRVPEKIWKKHYEDRGAHKYDFVPAAEIMMNTGDSSVGEHEYSSNKKRMEYLSVELPSRLSWVIEQRKKDEERMELMRRADMMLMQEIRKSLGLPTFESSSPCRKNHG